MPRLSSNLLPTTTVAGPAVAATAIVAGSTYRIVTPGSTDFTLIGAADSLAGTAFLATGAGTGSGTVSLEVLGVPVKGDGFYNYSDGLHTVAHYLSALDGILEVQGALTDNPVETDWVTLDTRTGTTGSPLTENATYNFTGNFVWIRAKVSYFINGTITKIQLNH